MAQTRQEESHKYRQRIREKHGCSPVARWRRSKPENAQKCCTRSRRDRERPGARERAAQYSAAFRFKLKVETFEAYGGLICVCCGESHLAFLTLDHVNNDGAAHRREIQGVTGFGQAFYAYLRKRSYPNDPPLQVLCYNCNCGKRANGGVCPHKEAA